LAALLLRMIDIFPAAGRGINVADQEATGRPASDHPAAALACSPPNSAANWGAGIGLPNR
jgi:hypothetical protein